MEKDYYSVLGVSRDADTFEIDMAYRKLFLKFHPDENKGDPFMVQHFENVNEAYKVLSKLARERDELMGTGSSGAKLNHGLDAMMVDQTPEVRNILKDLSDYLDKGKKSNDAFLKIEVAKHSSSVGYGIIFRLLIGFAIMYGTWVYFDKPYLFNTQSNLEYEWETIDTTTMFVRPDIKSRAVGTVPAQLGLSSLKETRYFIKVQVIDDAGNVATGYVLKSKLARH